MSDIDKADKIVDCSGLNCPLPILKTRQAIMKMSAGQVVKVISTDQTSVDDFSKFATATGNELLSVEEKPNQWIFYIKVG